MSSYKKLKNTTMQGLEIVLKNPNGQYDHVWLPSKKSVVGDSKNITDLVRGAQQRQMIKITNA